MLPLEEQNRWRDRYRQMCPGWRPATEVYAGLVRDCLTADSRVLDLGCGQGGLVEQLVERPGHPLRQLVGVDPDLPSLQHHRLPAMARVAGVSDALPLGATSIDLVFCSWLLEHLPAPERTFAEVARVLRPGGAFVFITPNARHPLSQLNQVLGRFARVQGRVVNWLYGRSAADAFPTTYRANTPDRIRHLSLAHNLTLVRFHTVPDPTYLASTPALFHAMCRLEEKLPPSRKLHLVGLIRRNA